ncbi:MAG: RluA family pseudouridine synthase [Spirulinaceae cyanobacterium]
MDSKHFSLQVKDNGDRLDRWLAENLPDLSRSRLQKLIVDGCVEVNEEICQAKKRLVQRGDRLQVNLPPVEVLEIKPEDIPLDILYEDEEIVFVNKPAGLVVHPAPGHEDGTLVNALLFHCHDLASIGGVKRPGIVHRLDKDTSGVLVVAKTDIAHQSLQKQIQDKVALKEYLGVVHGSPKGDSGTIDLPIGRHLINRKQMSVLPLEKGAREAVTHWQVTERLGNYTLMKFRLETGRTHQIRVHATHTGYPLVGDPVYGSGVSVGVNLSGQALHAQKLGLFHPISGEWLEAIAPLPDDFTKLLRVLRTRQ